MPDLSSIRRSAVLLFAGSFLLLAGCGTQPVVTNTNTNTANSNTTNSNAVLANTNANTSSVAVETREPDAYEALVTLKIQGTGSGQNMALPSLNARVSKSGNDRRMEFTMPAGGRVIFLDKGGVNYLILPDMKQYAVLDKAALGFDVRRMLLPEQIVAQVKNVQGMKLVGEEKYNGRDAVKYRYEAVASTESQAGQIDTDAFLIVDKATGLPLHTETVSQTQSGANIQGYSGLRIITEISEINTTPAADQFAEPTGFEKIDAEKVRAQVDMIFNAMATFLAQMLKQGQPTTAATATPAAR